MTTTPTRQPTAIWRNASWAPALLLNPKASKITLGALGSGISSAFDADLLQRTVAVRNTRIQDARTRCDGWKSSLIAAVFEFQIRPETGELAMLLSDQKQSESRVYY